MPVQGRRRQSRRALVPFVPGFGRYSTASQDNDNSDNNNNNNNIIIILLIRIIKLK